MAPIICIIEFTIWSSAFLGSLLLSQFNICQYLRAVSQPEGRQSATYHWLIGSQCLTNMISKCMYHGAGCQDLRRVKRSFGTTTDPTPSRSGAGAVGRLVGCLRCYPNGDRLSHNSITNKYTLLRRYRRCRWTGACLSRE